MKNSIDQTISPPKTTASFLIARGGSHYFKGYIGNVKIYNSALSSALIKRDYIAGLNLILKMENVSVKEYNKRLGDFANVDF